MSASTAPGRLHVVSTPIGNLGDFSFRAIETLRGVALILAEDTRHSRTLLDRYEIKTQVASYHEHNEAKMTPVLVQRLLAGDDLALISDAGTPLLSDPGARLVRAAIDAGISVTAVPGASALLSALVASGVSAERFTFFGFLPRKGRDRSTTLAELVSLRHTAVLYEAPSRVADTLEDLEKQGAGERFVVVARESCFTKRLSSGRDKDHVVSQKTQQRFRVATLARFEPAVNHVANRLLVVLRSVGLFALHAVCSPCKRV